MHIYIRGSGYVQGGNGRSMGNLTRASPEWVIIGDDRPSGARSSIERGESVALEDRRRQTSETDPVLISIYVLVTSIQTKGRCRGRLRSLELLVIF